jgi:hypothetical protein
VGLQEPSPFISQPFLLCRQLAVLLLCASPQRRQILAQYGVNLVLQLRVELLSLIELFNPFLNYGDRHGALGAVGCLLVATQADVVRVYRAMAVFRHSDDQPAAAVTAENAGLQIVGMLALFLPSCM